MGWWSRLAGSHPRDSQRISDKPASSEGDDAAATVPDELRRALPEVAPAVLFTGWSLAHHGYTVRDLTRILTLTPEQSRVIISHRRPAPGSP